MAVNPHIIMAVNPRQVYSIRSGSPGQKSLVRMVAALTPGVTVESMSFAYRWPSSRSCPRLR